MKMFGVYHSYVYYCCEKEAHDKGGGNFLISFLLKYFCDMSPINESKYSEGTHSF